MQNKYIDMRKVSTRENYLKSNHVPIRDLPRNRLKQVQENLTLNNLKTFINECIDSCTVDSNIIPVLTMIDTIDAPDNEKESMINTVTNSFIPRLSPSKVKDVLEYVAVNNKADKFSRTIENPLEDENIMDRIIKNNDILKNRFNFSKIISGDSYSSADSDDNTVEELCRLIDTYDISREAKYNIALENIQYSLFKAGRLTPKNEAAVVEHITDYFLSSSVVTDKDYAGIVKVINNNRTISEAAHLAIDYIAENKNISYSDRVDKLADDCDNPDVKVFILSSKKIKNEKQATKYIEKCVIIAKSTTTTKKDSKKLMTSLNLLPLIGNVSKQFVASILKLQTMKKEKDDEELYSMVNALYDDTEELDSLAEAIIKAAPMDTDIMSESYKEPVKNIGYLIESEDFADSSDVAKLIKDFKADQNKSMSRFKVILYRIYQKSPEEIIDESPNILSAIRMAFIVGIACIPMVGPALAAITAFVDKMISMHLNEKQAKKLMRALLDERKLVEEKLNNGKGDKEELEKYRKCLTRCIDKVDSYIGGITDKEDPTLDKYDSNYSGDSKSSSSKDDDDFDLDFDDGDLDLSLEASIFNDIQCVIALQEEYNNASENKKDIRELLDFALSEDAKVFEDIAMILNETGIYDACKMIDSYKPLKYVQLSISETSTVTRVSDKLHRSGYIIEGAYSDTEVDAKCYIQLEAINSVKKMVNTKDKKIINDKKKKGSSFNLNTIKLIIQDFKKKAKDLSTKEKSMWQSLDATMSGFTRAIEKALTSDRREAIIRGSIIPSFSRCVKLGLASGAAILINPVFGVIATLGAFGASKYLNHRERQLIYDEIETELKVVEKQLQIADNDGDMKQYRFLLQYQKKLERERQRIKYGMKVHGRDIPSSTAGRSEDW